MTSVTIAHIGRAFGSVGRLGPAVRVARLPAVWLRRVRERRELMSLLSQPDYIFRDVGLLRHDITQEAMKPFWRP